MSNNNFIVRKVAVLGAGVMGAQIAAHLINANVETLLFELPAKQNNLNANVEKAVKNLQKQEPSPLSTAAKVTYIQPANYNQHLALLKDCDIVIEAIAERMEWKTELYKKVAEKYPIVSMEDPLQEEDFEGFAALTRSLDMQTVGDDLFVTNVDRLREWVQKMCFPVQLWEI